MAWSGLQRDVHGSQYASRMLQFTLVWQVPPSTTSQVELQVLHTPWEQGCEADDIIGTLACRAREKGWEVVVVTGDKDFAQLVDGKIALYDPMAEASGRGGWTGPGEVEKKLGEATRAGPVHAVASHAGSG